MSGISFVVLLLVLVFRIFDIRIFGMRASDVQGFSSTILTILLIGGIQLISTGVLGEYIGRIYTEAKRRPTYIVLDKIVHPDTGLSSRTGRTGMLRSPPMARVSDDTA
jgi:dolichol-phosphate mannosyltransferase